MESSRQTHIKPKNIGIYGGTFDPVHLGHISLAFEIMEARLLDEVWFCPAYINPSKEQQKTPTSPEHRLKMLQMAIEKEPRFRINDMELLRQAPSYTVDTLKILVAAQMEKNNPDRFFLIMGEDTAQNFYRWRNPEEIITLATLLIGRRSLIADSEKWHGTIAIQEALRYGFTQTRIMDISSSEIRERIAKKLYCGHLLQEKVLDYIILNQLYS